MLGNTLHLMINKACLEYLDFNSILELTYWKKKLSNLHVHVAVKVLWGDFLDE